MLFGFAPVSGAPTQSEGAAPLRAFLELRESLGEGRIGGGGRDLCWELTSSLDAAVRELASGWAGSGLAVVAIGGYGRSELSPYSDVDLMLLHAIEDPSEAAAAVFRPLWDAGLRLGHAVRTVGEAAGAARERFDTFTTLLTSRLVAGDEKLFDLLLAQVGSVTRARPLRRHLVADERERRRRDPYLAMAADVKAGRGGLRTLHGFEWERRREALIGRFSPEPIEEEAVAREALLMVRNALHATAGRPYDMFAFDLRESVARWLDSRVYEVSENLVGALQTVDHLATRRWPELVEERDRPTRRLWNRLRGAGERPTSEGAPSATELAGLLRSGEQGRLTMERMREEGHLDHLIPEWEVVRVAPQLAPFHEHPVEAHLWRTVDEMQDLVQGGDGHYSAIAEQVDSPDVLTFAAFLHDVGKGGDGNHAVVGAGIARAFCDRIGCPPQVAGLVEGAVRHHLLLSETATRRDLDDPAVVAQVAETVGEVRLLQVLYLLTVADSRATGSAMWGVWKATLVRTLFIRCTAYFEADRPDVSMGGTTRDQVTGAAAAGNGRAVKAHLDAMPEEYLRSTSTDEVLWHLELIDGMGATSNLGVRPGEAASTAVVVGRSQPGFRRLVAESFAANGIDVLEARLASRTDGIIVDTFRVRDDRTAEPVPSARWDRVRADVEAALAGELDPRSKVAARAEAYSSVAAVLEPEVQLSIDDASDLGVVTIRCSDRIGRLAEVLSVLHDCELEIRLAKIDSRGGEVVDSFHVRGLGYRGGPNELDHLAERIAASIGR